MALQEVTLTLVDGALGLLPADTDKVICVFGVSSGGTPNTLYSVASADALAAQGFGPGAEALRWILDAGGRCYFVPVTQGTVGTNSAVSQPGTGSPPTVALTGAPFDAYTGLVEITKGGAIGTSMFRYSLDGGQTYSLPIATAATYPIAGSGLTVTFATGTYVLGHSYGFTSVAPYYTTSNLNAAFDVALGDNREWGIAYVVGTPTGTTDTLAAGATASVISAVATKMDSAASNYRFARAIVESNVYADGGTQLIAAGQAISAPRVSCVTAVGTVLSPLTGRKHVVNLARAMVAKLAVKAIGKDPSQVESDAGVGPLGSGVLSLSNDERKAPGLDDARFVTARTYVGRTGFYVSNFPLLSAPGSDYQYLQHGQIVDNASKVIRNALLDYLSQDLDLNKNGTLEEGQARSIEDDVDGQVRASLVAPGHANDCSIRANRTDDVLSTKTLRVSARIQPKFYPKTIVVDLGFTKTISVAV